MLNASLPNTSPTSQFSSQPSFDLSLFLESMLICAVLQATQIFCAPILYGRIRGKSEKKSKKSALFSLSTLDNAK